MTLRTSVSALAFHPSRQILALSSKRDKESLRLLHVPTRTVYANWPTGKTPLNYVWSMDFSPCGSYVAVGNDRGKCLLYRMGD